MGLNKNKSSTDKDHQTFNITPTTAEFIIGTKLIGHGLSHSRNETFAHMMMVGIILGRLHDISSADIC